MKVEFIIKTAERRGYKLTTTTKGKVLSSKNNRTEIHESYNEFYNKQLKNNRV